MEPVNKKINFSKFFPDDNAFVNIKGEYKKSDDWQLNFVIQSDLRHSMEIWACDWNYPVIMDQLLVIHEASAQAIDFVRMCSQQSVTK